MTLLCMSSGENPDTVHIHLLFKHILVHPLFRIGYTNDQPRHLRMKQIRHPAFIQFNEEQVNKKLFILKNYKSPWRKIPDTHRIFILRQGGDTVFRQQ